MKVELFTNNNVATENSFEQSLISIINVYNININNQNFPEIFHDN